MSARLVFHPDAAHDLADAATWYERQQPGLGNELELAVLSAVDLIEERPLAWPVWSRLNFVRCYTMTRFPYRLPYAVGEPLLLLAVAHTKRRPDYWLTRL